MKSVVVRLNNIEAITAFSNKAVKSNCKVTLLSGRYVIDGKSIMGVFSLDLSKPIECEVEGTKSEVEDFLSNIKELTV